MKNFETKVVVITGVGSGIGRALTLEFHKRGAKLALNDFNETSLLETVEMVEGSQQVYYKAFDVSDKKAFYQFAEDVAEHYGQVDVVINNAGVAIANLSTDKTTLEDYEWIIGINLWGMMYGTLAFLPHLRKQKESSVVNISSLFGLIGFPQNVAYSTTKFGIRGFSEGLAIEERLLKSGVAVTSVHPGGIKTNIARNSRHAGDDEKNIEKFEKAFITTPEDPALTIINGMSKKKLRVVVGKDAKVLFFISKISQRLSLWVIAQFAKKYS
jgi:NAD(P)-dependent dehydrogenase (short-subunit alcohol dehydrogenase family)